MRTRSPAVVPLAWMLLASCSAPAAPPAGSSPDVGCSGAGDGATDSGADAAPPAVDAADADADDGDAANADVPSTPEVGADALDADPDHPLLCAGNETAHPDRHSIYPLCDVVVRLDYETRAAIGYRLVCEPWFSSRVLDQTHAELAARGTLGIDTPLERCVTGADGDFGCMHASTGATDVGAFAIVDPTFGRAVVAGTSTATGGSLTQAAWNAPGDPGRCFPEFPRLLGATPFFPADAPFDEKLAREVADAAWYGPIGAYWEGAGGCTSHAFEASVLRWAPTLGGAYEEWIVAIHVGAGCPDD